jgi:hypothetical protein
MGPRHSARAYIITTETAHNPPSVRRGGEDGPPIRRINPNARPLRLPLRVVPGHWQPCFRAGLRAPTPGTRFGQVTPFCILRDLCSAQASPRANILASACGNQFSLLMAQLQRPFAAIGQSGLLGWRIDLYPRLGSTDTIASGSGSNFRQDPHTSFRPKSA